MRLQNIISFIIALVLLTGPTHAFQSTGYQTRPVLGTGLTVACTYPTGAPLKGAPVLVEIIDGKERATDVVTTFVVTTPRAVTKKIVPAKGSVNPFRIEADLDAPGVYRLMVGLVRDGQSFEETFLWSAEPFEIPRISPAELRDLVQRKEAILVDVRDDPKEIIRGAIVLPESDLFDRLVELPQDKLIATYCACNSEHSSALLSEKLNALGYRSVAIYGSYAALRADGWSIEVRAGARGE